ncbi:MAG: transporter substrate-binding domain-containing protein [Spirochaeta sp.]|nr:transporter substrate-binding domain-containing protein [Spirochaeta sp.]
MDRITKALYGALLSLLFILILPVAATASQPLVLATADTPPFSAHDGSGFYDHVLHETFSHMDIELEIRHLPSERALHDANSGRLDGEFGRIEAIGTLYPNLRMVHEPLAIWEFSAFVRAGDRTPADFNELGDYHVGYIRGWKIYEENVTETHSLSIAASEQQLFTMLQAGRIEVALYNKLRGLAWIARNPSADIMLAPEPLAVRPIYLFLHHRHADLIPELETALRSIKTDGTYDRFYREPLGPGS